MKVQYKVKEWYAGFAEQDAGMEALETQLLAVTGLLGEVSALQEQAAQLIAEADPPNGWLLEPTQADVEVSYAKERLPHFSIKRIG